MWWLLCNVAILCCICKRFHDLWMPALQLGAVLAIAPAEPGSPRRCDQTVACAQAISQNEGQWYGQCKSNESNESRWLQYVPVTYGFIMSWCTPHISPWPMADAWGIKKRSSAAWIVSGSSCMTQCLLPILWGSSPDSLKWGAFQKWQVPQNGCFIVENPWTSYKNLEDLGVPLFILFQETSKWISSDILGHLGTWRSDEIRSPAAEREQSRHNCGNRLGSSVRPMGCSVPWSTNGNYNFLPWCTMYPTLAIWITMFCWIFVGLSKFKHDFPPPTIESRQAQEAIEYRRAGSDPAKQIRNAQVCVANMRKACRFHQFSSFRVLWMST